MSGLSKSKKIIFIIIIIIVVLAALVTILMAFTKSNNVKTSKYNIVSTIYVFDQYVQNITDNINDIQTTILIPSNVEPHDYSPTPNDILILQRADLIIINGIFDKWVYNFPLDQNKIFDLSKEIPQSYLKFKDDPHYWMSFDVVKKIRELIAQKLSVTMPSHKDKYNENLDFFKWIDEDYINNLLLIYPYCKNNHILTSHQAYDYLANELNLKNFSILGSDPEADISASRIIQLDNYIKDYKIKYLLIDPKDRNGSIDEIINKYKLTTLEFYTLETKPDNKNLSDLLGLNKNSLITALECNNLR